MLFYVHEETVHEAEGCLMEADTPEEAAETFHDADDKVRYKVYRVIPTAIVEVETQHSTTSRRV